MSQKMLNPNEFYTFDLLEELIFFLMIENMKELYEPAPTRKEMTCHTTESGIEG